MHEGASSSTSSGYRRTKRTALWTDAETVQFYRALASLGTDFMLMENLFPGRTRRDLKLKFKREERVNTAQVEKALRSSCKLDATRLANEFRAEREKAERAAQELQQSAIDMKQQKKETRQLRVHKSQGARALGASALPSTNTSRSADELILQYSEAKTQESTASSQSATTARVMPKTKSNDMATISKKDTKSQGKSPLKQPPKTPELPSNVEEESLVVFTIQDPHSPPNRKLQTYMARAGGRLTPVTLPTKFLKTIITYMKTGVIPNDTSAGSAASPSSVASQDSRPCPTDPTPAVI